MGSNASVLVVDDEPGLREFLEIMLKKEGYEVDTAADGMDALEKIKIKRYDLLILDIMMPRMTGIEFLREFHGMDLDTRVIMLTAFASHTTAIEAMKLGAYDYITKPFKIDEIKLVIHRALESMNLEITNKRLKEDLESRFGLRNIIGESDAIKRIHELIDRLGNVTVNVLITGESGTGKELVARALHFMGPRLDSPFVAVNCGAIPETLIESELFGYKKGAFTGADKDKKGLFEEADGGTIFLDEIGDLPQHMQVKLLRVIEDKAVRKLGGTEDLPVDMRIIAATNRNLEDMVAQKTFRDDLYYRLNVVVIPLGPLRERKDDIPLLVDHFIKKHSLELGKAVEGITPEAMGVLEAYDYPGNVRELENIIARSVALVDSDMIDTDVLPAEVLGLGHTGPRTTISANLNLDSMMEDMEREILEKTLTKTSGKKAKAAKLLGITLRSLRYRLDKHGLLSEKDD